MSSPCAEPSVASDNAKQFASLANLTGLFKVFSKSPCKSSPIKQTEFAFLTRLVLEEIEPSIPTPPSPGKLMFALYLEL